MYDYNKIKVYKRLHRCGSIAEQWEKQEDGTWKNVTPKRTHKTADEQLAKLRQQIAELEAKCKQLGIKI